MTDISKQYAALPHELKVLPNWVCFNFEPNPDGGKAKKVPYQVDGMKASHSDPATWNSYNNCVAAVERGRFDTIGFAFTNTEYAGFDYDDCLDIDTGVLKAEAQEIVDRLCSYTEESVSGTGIHILMKGNLPEGRRKSSPVLPDTEMYDNSRFFVMTGEHWAGSPNSIEERTTELAELHRELFPPEPKKKAPSAPLSTNPMSDDDLIKKASASKGDKFAKLWAGNWQGSYPSQSEADLALCSSLAFWTGNESERIDRLFRRSGLMRKKWDVAYYRQKTIDYAIAGTHMTYRCEERAYVDRTETAYNAPTATAPSESPFTFSPALTEKQKQDVTKVLTLADSWQLSTMSAAPVEYLYEPFIVKGGILAVTGEAAHGKSTIVLSWLHEVANREDVMVVYCDSDNPLALAKERSERIRGPLDDHISYWGGFTTDDQGNTLAPWPITSPLWIDFIKNAGKHVVIVFDTLNSFMNGGDENSNAVVGGIMNSLRTMTHVGATCVVLHHTGKSATSKESRGASAFQGGVDAGWLVTSHIIDTEIKTMTLTAWKSRMGKTAKVTYKMEAGRPVRIEEDNKTMLVLNFILIHQGKTKDAIEKAANGKFSRKAVRDAIDLLLVAKKLKVVKNRYYAYAADRKPVMSETDEWDSAGLTNQKEVVQ